MTDYARVLARTDETTWVECPECDRAVEASSAVGFGPPDRVRVDCQCGYRGHPTTSRDEAAPAPGRGDLPF